MSTTRRSFLGLLASVAASPALAKLPAPVAENPCLEIDLPANTIPKVHCRAILSWTADKEAIYYEVFRGEKLLATINNSVSQVVFSSILPKGEQEIFFVRAMSPEGIADAKQPVFTRFVEDYNWPSDDAIEAI